MLRLYDIPAELSVRVHHYLCLVDDVYVTPEHHELTNIKEVRNLEMKVAVVGDIFLDKYYMYDPELGDPSLETGIKPIVVVDYTSSPGASANVAKDLALLGAKVSLVGIVGKDKEGRELLNLLEEFGIDTSGIMMSDDRKTQFYSKFINLKTKREDLPRVDRYDFTPLKENEREWILNELEKRLKEGCSLIMMDQHEVGEFQILDEEMVEGIKILRRKYPDNLFFADSRRNIDRFFDFSFIKCNVGEICRGVERRFKVKVKKDPYHAQIYARMVHERFKNPVILTLGEYGCFISCELGDFKIEPLKVKVVDVCGAGDYYTSGFVVKYMESGDILESVAFASLVSGKCVEQIGTGRITMDDIRALRTPRYFKVPKEVIVLNTNRLHDEFETVLFDFDGTISLLRRGWEDVMKEVMIESIVGEGECDGSLRRKIEMEVDEFIDRSTGVRTIVQMKVLKKMVEKYGLNKKILTEWEYKDIYTTRLRKIVRERMRKGEPSEFLLPGVLEFLEYLKDRGIKIFLISGTDSKDVKEEAEYIGVLDYFEKIEGASKDFSKLKFFEWVSRSFDPRKTLVFGDGPVEIMLGGKYDMRTFGVAMDEFTHSWSEKKMKRLIEAGADNLILNFHGMRDLLKNTRL